MESIKANKRAISLIHDILWLLLFAIIMLSALPDQAYAYVDPSVMTYAIQAIAGVAVALSAVLGVAFRRTRKALLKLLRIDEDAQKYKEPDVHRIQDGDSSEEPAEKLLEANKDALQLKEQVANGKASKPLKWLPRFLIALIISFFFILTVFVCPQLEVVASNSDYLIFNYTDMYVTAILIGLVSSLILGLAVSSLKGKPFAIAIALLSAFALCAYIQAMFMNTELPLADGSSLDLMGYKTITCISTAVWVAIIGLAIFFVLKDQAIYRFAAVGIGVALSIVQIVGIVSLTAESFDRDSILENTFAVTNKGLDTVSSEDNVIVFVLDTFDTQYLNRTLEEYPDALDGFTGFTLFENSSAAMIPTAYGIPVLLSGKTVSVGDNFEEFRETWVEDSPFLHEIYDNGYNLGVYSDSLYRSLNYMNGFVDNIHTKDFGINYLQLILTLDKVALYRELPWLLKPIFWFTTDEINNAASLDGSPESTPYTLNDAKYKERLLTNELQFSDDDKVFRFIHLLGAHYPYVLDENGNESSETTSVERQCRGSLAIVQEYLDQLKELGVYDDATIIITADHGWWYLEPNVITEPSTALMLVKPSETPEEAAEPVKVSYAPVSVLDLPATIIDAIGGDASAYGPTVFDIAEDSDRLRYYWMTTSNGHDNVYFKEFVIDGDVLDFDNWELTGNVVEVHPGSGIE